MNSSYGSVDGDADDEEMEVHLENPLRAHAEDDQLELNLLVDVAQARELAVAARREDHDIVSRKTGGWKYSISRLLQAILYAHYLRCAADFARSVVFAVYFALGAKAGMISRNS